MHETEVCVLQSVCVYLTLANQPAGTHSGPEFTTGVAKPLTQMNHGNVEHHSDQFDLHGSCMSKNADRMMQNTGPREKTHTFLLFLVNSQHK